MDDQQLLRYSRQIMLPQIDIAGQESLLNATVLLVGVGGLGSASALYLAASGVGRLVLVDDDQVEISNLQRQIIHSMENLQQDKVASAKENLARINPDIEVISLVQKADQQLLQEWLPQVDVVLDGSDNFTTRFLVNRQCWAFKKPLVSAAAIRMEGQISVFDPRTPDSPCYRCLYDDAQDQQDMRCANNGILSPVVGMLGVYQALEAVKLITSTGQPLVGRLQLFDAMTSQWREMKLTRDAHCPICN